eukprot:TRINITY_DN2219_c0_g1_i1.p1 TRINITY_DN2219_c0_g1~~TRINITY_DN2219_c0_g1_i1.p1  ORF type:complete len:355 (-),score=116.03 TRINITY_DN2219_c0_g1_i1:33-1097(-)
MADTIPPTTTALVLQKIDDLVFEERKTPTVGPHDVLIAVKSVGICGSDVHYWKHGRIGSFILEAPMIMGHESSGQIAAVGSQVKDLKVGDRITMEPGTPCRRCDFCKIGRYNLCALMEFHATPPYDGSLSNYIVHPADLCFKLPENVSYDEGAMCEPLAVGVHAVTRANVRLGQTVLVTGSGPIGLMSLMAAKAAGAGVVIITDISAERLKMAKECGADFTIDSKNTADVVAEIKKLSGGGVDATIECSGAEIAVKTAIHATKSGGNIVLVGMGGTTSTIPLVDACIREITITGVFRYANCYPKAIALISSGKVNVKPLITHHFGFQESIEAFTTAKDGADKNKKPSVKVIINL